MNAFETGIVSGMEKVALKASTIASAAKKRGISPGQLRQYAQARVENARIMGMKHKLTPQGSRAGTYQAFRSALDGAPPHAGSGSGRAYAKSWVKNKPKMKDAYKRWLKTEEGSWV